MIQRAINISDYGKDHIKEVAKGMDIDPDTAVELAQSALTDYFYEELPIYLAENA